MNRQRYLDYLASLRKPFIKLCRLRFLNPDGSTAFALDNNPLGKRNTSFIAEGNISVNLQNGQRRTATSTLYDVDGSFAYKVNRIWFGQEIAIDEGLILPNGEEFYIQQGVFLFANPTDALMPNGNTYTYNLVDKWANLDGSLFGNLDATYEVERGTNIFAPIASLLALDRGNGIPIDRVKPVFTEYYNGKTQKLPSGGSALLTNTPYTLRVSADGGNYGGVVLGLTEMLNAWVGYDPYGALRVDPSQDDILDSNKPVQWQFSADEVTFLGATYTVKNSEVYNDYIVVGEQLSDYSQPSGRATNYDPKSDTNANLIGKKTLYVSKSGFATDTQCQDYAEWKLKRATVLQKAVSVSCSQLFHIKENELITIVRADKEGAPAERHLIQGFTRPLTGNDQMTISCVSTSDFPIVTKTSWGS